MMEGSKKFEDAALRGVMHRHVWKSRTSDLTVIQLRNPNELLGTPEAVPAVVAAATVAAPAPAAAATAVAAEAKRSTVAPALSPSAPPPRPTTGKQESLSALLSKLQLGRPAAEAAGSAKALQPSVAPPATAAVSPSAPPSHSAAACGSAPSLPAVSLAPSPPVRVAETHNPTFPDLKESSSAMGRFEFITGTNIPGQGIVKRQESLNESSSMALFHDPLWGGGSLLDAFPTPPPAKKSPQLQPQPQPRASLAELYAGTAMVNNITANSAATTSTTGLNPVNVFHTGTQPGAMHTPIASPPVPTMTSVAPMQAAMASQPMQMMGEIMGAPASQLATSYPMYTMPLQYVAQPQFPGSVMYNSAAFFPYSAAAMMLPQQMSQQMSQHINQQLSQQLGQQMNQQIGQPMGQHMGQSMSQQFSQGFSVSSATMVRPGTNVKAMPFVPGGTM